MSHRGKATSSPADQSDWNSILVETAKKLAARWKQLETTSIDSAARLALAIVYAMVETGTPVQNVPGLVWTIANNTLSAENRRPYNRREVTNHDFEQDVGNEQRSPEKIVLTQEFHRALESAIIGLPDELRVPLVAHLLEGMPYEEIHRRTGLHAGTARNNVCKARKLVRAVMEKQGYLD